MKPLWVHKVLDGTRIPKSGNDVAVEFIRGLLVNILMTKKHKVKLKQTWKRNIRSNVLSRPMKESLMRICIPSLTRDQ